MYKINLCLQHDQQFQRLEAFTVFVDYIGLEYDAIQFGTWVPNVADELGFSIFWEGKAVTLAPSSGIWRPAVWQMDVSSDGDFYVQFAVCLSTVTNTSQRSLSFIGLLPRAPYFSRPPFPSFVPIIYNPPESFHCFP